LAGVSEGVLCDGSGMEQVCDRGVWDYGSADCAAEGGCAGGAYDVVRGGTDFYCCGARDECADHESADRGAEFGDDEAGKGAASTWIVKPRSSSIGCRSRQVFSRGQ